MRTMMPKQRLFTIAALTLATAVFLAACGGGEEPTPTPTKTPMAQTQPTATPTLAPVAVGNAGAQPPAASAPTNTPVPPTPAPVVEKLARVAVDQLNVRSEPSTAGAIVRLANNGETFTLLGQSEDGQWLQLGENGAPLGWGAAEFMTIEERIVQAPAGSDQATAPTAAPAGGVAGNFAPATMSSPDYGAQVFVWWREEIRDRDLDLMKEAGFNWIKQAFSWESIEGAGRGQYDWSIADKVVTHANERGLKILARLSLDPDVQGFWAGDPPTNGDAFAEYAGALAARYNCQPGAIGCIQAYQIWNEPNLAREWGGKRPNPAEYVEFLGKAYRAIKAANPNAIVISAGMAPTGDNSDIAMPDDVFYDQMYQAMGGNSSGYFDALGVHGAGYAAPPELDPAEAASNPKYGGYRFFAFRHVEDIRAIMEKYGDTAKKIVLLEFGWTFDPVNPAYKWHGADAGIDMFVQADYLVRAYKYAAANWPWVGLMSLLTMPNLDWLNDGNGSDEEQYWWAIMEPSPINAKEWRPAYIELCIYLNSLRGQRCIYDPNQ
ncbi:MAG TPA: cellulase family glycosylhydrolase [Chloroflexi bacterium]|nr:cellulase family glycosylhydrolase [Chloroflexota bacterium]